MTLIIDSREPKHLTQELLAEIPGSKVDMLAYGDFIVEGSNQRFVIERKSIMDLFASLNDGRLWDQMKGIEKFEGFKRILLIEGNIWHAHNWNPRITLARYTGIKVSLLYGWQGITLIETESQNETVDFLKRLVSKVGAGQPEEYTRGLGFVKEMRTPDEELVDVLRGYDGVGPAKAEELLTKFKTLKHVADAPLRELTQVLGEKDANHVFKSFRRRYGVKKPKVAVKEGGSTDAPVEG